LIAARAQDSKPAARCRARRTQGACHSCTSPRGRSMRAGIISMPRDPGTRVQLGDYENQNLSHSRRPRRGRFICQPGASRLVVQPEHRCAAALPARCDGHPAAPAVSPSGRLRPGCHSGRGCALGSLLLPRSLCSTRHGGPALSGLPPACGGRSPWWVSPPRPRRPTRRLLRPALILTQSMQATTRQCGAEIKATAGDTALSSAALPQPRRYSPNPASQPLVRALERW
jgi:hypothetical protein